MLQKHKIKDHDTSQWCHFFLKKRLQMERQCFTLAQSLVRLYTMGETSGTMTIRSKQVDLDQIFTPYSAIADAAGKVDTKKGSDAPGCRPLQK